MEEHDEDYDVEGYDERFIIVAPTTWLEVFAALLKSRWPSMLISPDGFGIPPRQDRWVEDLGTLDEIEPNFDEIYFVRDQQMLDHCNEYLFAPMDDGQGLVAIWFSRPDHRPFSVDEPRVTRDPLGRATGQTTDRATLFLPSTAVSGTLVTPTPVGDGGFSAEVWELLGEAFAKAG